MSINFTPTEVPATLRETKPNPYQALADKLLAGVGETALAFDAPDQDAADAVLKEVRRAVGKAATVRLKKNDDGTFTIWAVEKITRKVKPATEAAPVIEDAKA